MSGKDIQGLCFLFLEWLAQDKTASLFFIETSFFKNQIILMNMYTHTHRDIYIFYIFMELYRKEYSKGFHRGSLLNIFYDKLAYKSRMLDTMFSNKPLKLPHLLSRLSFWRMTITLHPFWARGERRGEKTEKRRGKKGEGKHRVQICSLSGPAFIGIVIYLS